MEQYDLILAGGGLANGLIADRLLATQPDLKLLVIERGGVLGGNHTWSFHDTDISRSQHQWLAPYVAHRWSRQEVRFPGLQRVLETGYCSVPSERFHAVLSERLGSRLRTDLEIVDLTPTSVTLANQARLVARCVIDGRGQRGDPSLALGFQKFIGRELETKSPHGRAWPIIMDATVSQKDGYRFVYTLPLDAHRMLIEDTYYSKRPDLDLSHLRRGIDDYATENGWQIARTVREEHGVLPIVLAGDIDAYWADAGPTAQAGLRAALFHPTTGYSLPDAAALAEKISLLPEISAAAVATCIIAHSKALWRDRGFFRMLNRLLFIAARDDERIGVMARFYGLPEPLIQRFYAGQLTLADKARILAGKPPIPVSRALACIGPTSAWRFARDNGV